MKVEFTDNVTEARTKLMSAYSKVNEKLSREEQIQLLDALLSALTNIREAYNIPAIFKK